MEYTHYDSIYMKFKNWKTKSYMVQGCIPWSLNCKEKQGNDSTQNPREEPSLDQEGRGYGEKEAQRKLLSYTYVLFLPTGGRHTTYTFFLGVVYFTIKAILTSIKLPLAEPRPRSGHSANSSPLPPSLLPPQAFLL